MRQQKPITNLHVESEDHLELPIHSHRCLMPIKQKIMDKHEKLLLILKNNFTFYGF